MNILSPNAGKITPLTQAPPRQVQLGARFTF